MTTAHFPTAPQEVSATDVLSQSIQFNPNQWTSRAPAGFQLPPVLPTEPTQAKWPEIDREALLSLPEPQTAQDAFDLYVAAATWGTGTKARSVARSAKVLHEDAVGEKLLSALQLLRSEGPTPAYASLRRRGANKVKHLGPAFFTKVLYFAGYGRAAGDLQPLILDKNVILGLNELFRLDWRTTGERSSRQYNEYLSLAEEARQAWGWDRADQVEYALFRLGRSLK